MQKLQLGQKFVTARVEKKSGKSSWFGQTTFITSPADKSLKDQLLTNVIHDLFSMSEPKAPINVLDEMKRVMY